MKRKFSLLENVERKGNHCEDYYVIDDFVIEQGKDAIVNFKNVEKAVNQIIDTCVSSMGRERATFNFQIAEKFEDEYEFRDDNVYFYGIIVNKRIIIGTHTREEAIKLIDNRIRDKYNIPESYYYLEEYFSDENEEHDEDWYDYVIYDAAIDDFRKEEKLNLLSEIIDYLD